jgi:hypothetical protein
VVLRSSLIPPSMEAFGDASCRVGAVDLSRSLVPEPGSLADGLAELQTWARVGSVDLAGSLRNRLVGAFARELKAELPLALPGWTD